MAVTRRYRLPPTEKAPLCCRAAAQTLLLLIAASAATAGVKPIYGNDDRKEVHQSSLSMCNISVSVAAIFPSTAVEETNGTYKLNSGANLLSKNWCEEERFVSQSSGALCTAFLIADDTLVTAGHCINTTDDRYGPGLNCEDTVFVFEHKLDRYDNLPKFLNENQLYFCDEVLAGAFTATAADWRVIKLDRKTRRPALPVYTEDAIPPVTSGIDIVGHPLGLPMKVARNGNIITEAKDFLITDIDSYEGNSGSPALSEVNGQLAVVGVLSSGAPDSHTDDKRNCIYSRRCTAENCSGEKITLANLFSHWAGLAYNDRQASWIYHPNRQCQ